MRWWPQYTVEYYHRTLYLLTTTRCKGYLVSLEVHVVHVSIAALNSLQIIIASKIIRHFCTLVFCRWNGGRTRVGVYATTQSNNIYKWQVYFSPFNHTPQTQTQRTHTTSVWGNAELWLVGGQRREIWLVVVCGMMCSVCGWTTTTQWIRNEESKTQHQNGTKFALNLYVTCGAKSFSKCRE